MPDAPRIVSLIASATEIVAALGFADQLVGRSHECDHPPEVLRLPACSAAKVDPTASSQTIDAQVRAIVADGLSVYRVDPRQLDELAPTVIVTQTQCEVCAVSLSDVETAVCDMVSSHPAIVSLEPMSLDDIWRDIRRVAGALGASERGDALVDRLQTRLEELRRTTVRLGSRPTIACLEWIDPLMTAGHWVPELVEIAGGEMCFGEAGRHSGQISLDDLVSADPDVVAATPCGFDLARTERDLPGLAAQPGWTTLSAVGNDRVYATDGNQYFNRPGPRLVETAEILVELLHPGAVDFGHQGAGWRPWSAPARS